MTATARMLLYLREHLFEWFVFENIRSILDEFIVISMKIGKLFEKGPLWPPFVPLCSFTDA